MILIGIKGEGSVTDEHGNVTPLREGTTLLVPASASTVSIAGTVKFLETYI